jgi:hypothetical protein
VIDNGTKVRNVWNKVKDPAAAAEEERRRKLAEEKRLQEEKDNPRSNKKAGAWAGLPPRK